MQLAQTCCFTAGSMHTYSFVRQFCDLCYNIHVNSIRIRRQGEENYEKIISIVLTAVMVLSLTACEDSPKVKAADVDGAALEIAIMTCGSGVDDGSFNADNYKGVLKFIAENPASTVVPLREETGDAQAAAQMVKDIAAEYDVLVLCGFQFAGIGDLASDYPNTKFILVDSWPSVGGSEATPENPISNVYGCTFAEQEAGFFAGVAAAMETKTGKVASLHGIAYPTNVNYQYGFECGVKYTNVKKGKNVEVVALPSYAGTDVTGANVGGNYVGSFADPGTGKVISETLIDRGVDIIFAAGGSSGAGAFTAAKEDGGVFVIGVDADQYDDGEYGDSNVVLTSTIKAMHLIVYNELNKVADGSFVGACENLTAANDYTGYIKDEGRHQMSSDTLAFLAQAYQDVKEGRVVPAANFNGITPDTFTVE